MLLWGCASSHAPQFISLHNSSKALSTKIFDSSIWLLDSLKPTENTMFYRRRIAPISIHMDAHGEGNYILEISANEKKLSPFVLTMTKGSDFAKFGERAGDTAFISMLNNGSEEIDFSGKIIWYIKPKGRCESIIVALYSIERTDLCKTEVKTLLKQFHRRYNVKHRKRTF